MTDRKYLSAAEMAAVQRQLVHYSQVYPDSDFLDHSLQYAQSGGTFTAVNAAKIEEALARWAERITAPAYDPDRVPPGLDEHIWQLALHYQQAMEARGWPCLSRRVIYAEIGRVTARDGLRGNHAPWRDGKDGPGWYRMMRDVITAWCEEYTAANALASPWAHEQLARPGEVARIAGYLKDQAMAALLDGAARPVPPARPSPSRRAAVKAYIASRTGKRQA